MLARLTDVVDRLIVYPDNMRRNLDLHGGLVHSQRVLLALTQAGLGREEAYRIVQASAMRAWRGEGGFRELIGQDTQVRAALDEGQLDALFDLDYHLKHVDTIFSRVFAD